MGKYFLVVAFLLAGSGTVIGQDEDELIFSDGFETGDTTAWSGSVP